MRSLKQSSRGSTMTEDRKSVLSGHSSNVSVPTITQESSQGKQVITPLRKFTQGVCKPGEARQAREAVRTVMSSHNPSRIPPLSQPLDYEKFVTDRAIQLENDAQRDLFIFPRDDVSEVLIKPEQSTEVPTATPSDAEKATWLLTKEAIHFYTQPYHTICFNYSKFSGDYTKVNQGSTVECFPSLPSLVFESDLALEEAKASDEGFTLPEIVKEGFVILNKSEGTLIPNPMSGKKRYCLLRRTELGDIILEIKKSPSDEAKIIKINSAQLRQTKKGKPILEIEQIVEDTDKVEKSEKSKPLTMYSDSIDEINSWRQSINLAISFATKTDSVSTCSENMEKINLGKHEQQQDAISTHSEDSYQSRDTMMWRGKDTAAKALAPPLVERHNMFSLYYGLAPLYSDSKHSRKTRWNCSPDGADATGSSSFSFGGDTVHTFSVKFEELIVKLPVPTGGQKQIEPFYISIFLFDSQFGRRLSEEFHIDAAGSRAREVTPGANDPLATCIALSTHSKITEALFNVCPLKELWLVCRIDRGLHSDTTGDVYMKPNPDPKMVQKMQKNIESTACKVSSYKQKFAWTAKPIRFGVFNSRETMSLPLYRCENNRLADQDLQKNLAEFTKLEKSRFLIPNASIAVTIDHTASSSKYPCRINPSILPLRPWNFDTKERTLPIFEVQSFGDVVINPHTELVNLLYVYPISLKYDNQKLFSKARNIVCTVKFIRKDDITNLSIIDRLAANGPFVSQASCAVQHHQQFPFFGEEVKIKLPLSLTSSDYILFSFTHVSISGQPSAKSSDNCEIPIGYAWCPLVDKKERLELDSDEQEIALPVAATLPHCLIRSRSIGKDDTDIRWVDQKPLFRCRLRLVSSVFTTENQLQSFFRACQKLEERGIINDATDSVKITKGVFRKRTSHEEILQLAEGATRSCSPLARYASFHSDNPAVHDITKWTESLVNVPIEKLLPFLPIVLSRLFAIFPHAPSDVLALSTIRTIISICDKCIHAGRKGLLRTFVKLHFVVSNSISDESVHNSICRYIPAVVREAKINKDETFLKVLFPQLWFFLDLAAKSIAQTILRKGLVKVNRKDRISVEVLETLQALIESIVHTIVAQNRELPEECRAANIAIAQFLKVCLSFLNRGAVFSWIYFVIRNYDEQDSKYLRDFKNTLLVILCKHEHWLPLNLPVLLDDKNQIKRIGYQSTFSDTTSTSNEQFSFSRLFLQMFTPKTESKVIDDSNRYANCSDEWRLCKAYAERHFLLGLLFQEMKAAIRESRETRRQSFLILRNLLAKHSFDRRYSDMSMQQRIAILYAPLLRFAVDIINELYTVVQDGNCGPGLRILSKPFESKDTPADISTPVLDAPLVEKLDSEEVRDFIISVLYVIHRLPRRILAEIWLESDLIRALPILQILEIATKIFCYQGKELAASVSTKRNKATTPLLNPVSPRFSSVGDLNQSNFTDSGRDEDSPIPYSVLQLLNLSQEIAMIILEASQKLSEAFTEKYSKSLSNGDNHNIFAKFLTLHLEFLKDNWPESIRLHAIAALSLFINQYRSLLFEAGPLDALSILIEHVLLQMASRLPSIQTSAAGLLQLILRFGYETIHSQLVDFAIAASNLPSSKIAPEVRQLSPAEKLGRPGTQTGVALARLLGTKSTIFPSHRFEKGLIALEQLVSIETKKGTEFDKSVLMLIKQLRGVMLATVALKHAENDSIRLAELHVQLADSYRGSAALRSAWFDALANVHISEKYFSEAAVCLSHSVAIIAKELAEKDELELDWSIFNWISKEIADEEKSVGKERAVQPGGFTIDNLTQKIEFTAQILTSAERYEAIGPLYRIVLPVLEAKREFNALVSIYHELQQCYSRAGEIKLSNKRHLGAYFRVRFIGSAFECDCNTEWVYKEAGLTSLAEASLRMKEICQNKNINNVRILSETEVKNVNGSDVDAFLQITHVDPFIEEGQNVKDFSTHTNLFKFVYETPIVEEGMSNGDLAIVSQALKRVVLEVSGQFPGCARRMKVLNQTETILSPLEFACQKLAMKAVDIRSILTEHVEGRVLDIKRLQLILQGAVMATVNAGPLAYAEAFTHAEQINRYGEQGIEMLKSAFRELISACESALYVNKSAIGTDQVTYHEVLNTSFEAMKERLRAFFGNQFLSNHEEEKKVFNISTIHVLDSIGGIIT